MTFDLLDGKIMDGFSRKQTLEHILVTCKEIPDRAIIVGCHCDTDFKMRLTINLLKKIRGKFKDNIFLVVHLPVSYRGNSRIV